MKENKNMVNQKSTNSQLLILLESTAYQQEFYFTSELFFFLLQYSFLFKDNDKTQKTCTLKTTHFHIPQGNGEKGARYLDPKYSRWISTDPALGEYVPTAPVNDEAKKHNQNLPGMGGLFNSVNLSLYHYAGNNPIRYTDPDGKFIIIPMPSSSSSVTMDRDGLKRFYKSVVDDYNNYKNANWVMKAANYFGFSKSLASAMSSSDTLMSLVENAGKIGAVAGDVCKFIGKADAAMSVFNFFFPKGIAIEEQTYVNFNTFYSDLENMETQGAVVSNIILTTTTTSCKNKGVAAGGVPFIQIQITTTTKISADITYKNGYKDTKKAILSKVVNYKNYMNCVEF